MNDESLSYSSEPRNLAATIMATFLQQIEFDYGKGLWVNLERVVDLEFKAMAYSGSDFNEPEFSEYDPTPYGGGYDLVLTYGKPLPPSDAICYPQSVSDPGSSSSLEGFSYGSSDAPYGKEEVDNTRKPPLNSNGGPPIRVNEEEQPSYGGSGNWQNGPYSGYDDYRGEDIFGTENDYGSGYGKPEGEEHGDGYYETEELPPAWGYDSRPGSDYGYENGHGREEDSYGYGRQEPPTPYDLGPCAGLFGYWPCLSQNDQKRSSQQDAVEQCYGEQWKGTADYLFGSLYPYGRTRDELVSYGDPNNGYKRHYEEQYPYRQENYSEPLSLQQLRYCESYQEELYPRYKDAKSAQQCITELASHTESWDRVANSKRPVDLAVFICIYVSG